MHQRYLADEIAALTPKNLCGRVGRVGCAHPVTAHKLWLSPMRGWCLLCTQCLCMGYEPDRTLDLDQAKLDALSVRARSQTLAVYKDGRDG